MLAMNQKCSVSLYCSLLFGHETQDAISWHLNISLLYEHLNAEVFVFGGRRVWENARIRVHIHRLSSQSDAKQV